MPLFLLFQVFVPIHGRGIGDFAAHQHDGVSAESILSALIVLRWVHRSKQDGDVLDTFESACPLPD